MGDAGLVGIALRMDDFDHLADHRFGEGGVELVADLDESAAAVGYKKYCTIHGGAVVPHAVVTDDLGLHPAGIVADEQQVAAQQQRQRRSRQSEAEQEDESFDKALLSQLSVPGKRALDYLTLNRPIKLLIATLRRQWHNPAKAGRDGNGNTSR